MVNKYWIALALFLLTCVCFGHVSLCEFVAWDDQVFVTDNPHVLGGLSGANIRWAFSIDNYGGWVPLMWLSLQLDATLFGSEGAWGFHLTNLLMHAASVVLFFHLLERMTGESWPSAICAALFAIHPLRVESVAWIAERRDVLSMLLLLVTVAAYYYYTECPGWGRYLLVLLSFGLGLAAKQMLVTLPFALLLLDYWPLYRLRLGQAAPAAALTRPAVPWRLLILEKVPLLAMALAVSWMTVRHVQESGQMSSEYRWRDRLAVSLAAYLGYLEKTFWPANLAALYPYRVPPWWVAMFAAGLLMAITVTLAYVGRRRPMLLVGWLWFVGTLFPVSGVIPIGSHAMADRYSYVPHLGLMMTVVWGLGGLSVWQEAREAVRTALVSLVLAGLGMLTWIQVWSWQNTETLFKHTLSITVKNSEFHAALSDFLEEKGDFKGAEDHLARALAIAPNNPRFNRAYGAMLIRQEKYQDAVAQLETSLRLGSDPAETHNDLGVALDKLGRQTLAREHLKKSIEYWDGKPPVSLFGIGVSSTPFRKARPYLWLSEMALRDGDPDQALVQIELVFAIKPDLTEACQVKGIALGRLERWPEAEAALQSAVKLAPDNSTARGYLAFTYAQQDKTELAAREYQDLLVRSSAWVQASNDFAMKRVTKASLLDPRMAEEVALQICEATQYKDPRWLDTLAAAQAARGNFTAARETAHKALGLMPDPALKRQLEDRLRFYKANQPLPREQHDQ